MKYRLITTLFLILLSHQSLSAGFNCNLQNLSATEKTICANDYLSGLDSALNKFYTNTFNSSLSRGDLATEQAEWLNQRNQCQADVQCITDKYIARNRALSSMDNFSSARDIFNRPGDKLDTPFDKPIITQSGFTITDNPWPIKLIFSSESFEEGINLEDKSVSSILTYQNVNNNLAVYISVRGKYQGRVVTLIVELVDGQSPKIIQQYDGELSIVVRKRDDHDSAITYFSVGSENNANYYSIFISPDGVKNIAQISSDEAKAFTSEAQKWTGYCGKNECNATTISPDGKWRLASTDDNVNEPDEGMYYFPVNRPDMGINVFVDKADNSVTDDAFGYMRNYTWGTGQSFYFDNTGALGCIWKTDIVNKTTQRIIPVEGILDPIYANYNGEDVILSVYEYSEADDYIAEVYIAKNSE